MPPGAAAAALAAAARAAAVAATGCSTTSSCIAAAAAAAAGTSPTATTTTAAAARRWLAAAAAAGVRPHAAFSTASSSHHQHQHPDHNQQQQQQPQHDEPRGAPGSGGGGGATIDFGFQSVPQEAKRRLVARVFSSVAPSYDVMNDLMSGGLHRLWKDRLVEVLAPFAGMRHLDVAGGTGDVAFRVRRAVSAAEALEAARRRGAAAGGFYSAPPPEQQPEQQQQQQPEPEQEQQQQRPPGHVTVFDINAEMLAVGRERAAQQGLSGSSSSSSSSTDGDGGLSWVQGDAEALPFPDNSFDGYTVAFGIRNVTRRDAALAEARRVLRPGGRLLCLEFSRVRALPLLQQLYDAYSFHVIPAVGGLVAGDEASYRYLVESIRRFPDQERWAGQIRAAGFKGVSYEDLTGGVVAIHSGFKL